MQATSIPAKVPMAFATNGTKNIIPTPSQIPITPGAASWNDGFPPLTMTPIISGGVPPSGADMNGVLYAMSAWNNWEAAGGQVTYDATFSGVIGGYPQGAVLANATVVGLFWISTVDNNTTDPDTGGSGWAAFSSTNILCYAGNPQGHVAGTAGTVGGTPPTLCWNTVGNAMYACTTSGTTSSAVWIQIGGGSAVTFVGGVSTGSANAQACATLLPSGFTLTTNYVITFTPGYTTTGPTTFNAATTGAIACRKNSGGSLVAFTGGEFTLNVPVSVAYNGTYWVLQANTFGALASLNIGRNLYNDGAGNLASGVFGQMSTIASSSTTNLGSAATNFVQITGTTTVNLFGTSAISSAPLYVVTFAASLQLINSSNMILPGGRNINANANDFGLFQYLGSGTWICCWYWPAGGLAPLVSPALTGTPTVPTAGPGTNTTQAASTAFVTAAVNGLAPIASPNFSGVPQVPTAAPGTNTTQAASTAFVRAAVLAANASYLWARDEKPSGTPPQLLTKNTWNQRVLGVLKYNSISAASLSGNQITLPAGTYRIDANALVMYSTISNVTVSHKIRIYNVTASTELISGMNEQIEATYSSSTINGIFTLSGTSVIEMDHWLDNPAYAGSALSSGDVEVYAEILLTLIA